MEEVKGGKNGGGKGGSVILSVEEKGFELAERREEEGREAGGREGSLV